MERKGKGRYCTLGYMQQAGTHYFDCFAPNVKRDSFKFFWALYTGLYSYYIKLQKVIYLLQCDLSQSYLNADRIVERTQWMRAPTGFDKDDQGNTVVWGTTKGAYGDKDPGRSLDYVVTYLLLAGMTLGMVKHYLDFTLYFYDGPVEDNVLILMKQTDDMHMMASDPGMMADIIEVLADNGWGVTVGGINKMMGYNVETVDTKDHEGETMRGVCITPQQLCAKMLTSCPNIAKVKRCPSTDGPFDSRFKNPFNGKILPTTRQAREINQSFRDWYQVPYVPNNNFHTLLKQPNGNLVSQEDHRSLLGSTAYQLVCTPFAVGLQRKQSQYTMKATDKMWAALLYFGWWRYATRELGIAFTPTMQVSINGHHHGNEIICMSDSTFKSAKIACRMDRQNTIQFLKRADKMEVPKEVQIRQGPVTNHVEAANDIQATTKKKYEKNEGMGASVVFMGGPVIVRLQPIKDAENSKICETTQQLVGAKATMMARGYVKGFNEQIKVGLHGDQNAHRGSLVYSSRLMTDNTATDRKNNEPGVGKIENVDDHARHMSVYKDVANGELHSIHIPREEMGADLVARSMKDDMQSNEQQVFKKMAMLCNEPGWNADNVRDLLSQMVKQFDQKKRTMKQKKFRQACEPLPEAIVARLNSHPKISCEQPLRD